jgi:hypothetical protein
MAALRSLFSYVKTYGYTGANPAHSDFVAASAVPRDGKTVGFRPAGAREPASAESAVGDVAGIGTSSEEWRDLVR